MKLKTTLSLLHDPLTFSLFLVYCMVCKVVPSEEERLICWPLKMMLLSPNKARPENVNEDEDNKASFLSDIQEIYSLLI